MDWEALLQNYIGDLDEDENLVDEAICTLEEYFTHADRYELMHFSRHLAVAYLALIKCKKECEVAYAEN